MTSTPHLRWLADSEHYQAFTSRNRKQRSLPGIIHARSTPARPCGGSDWVRREQRGAPRLVEGVGAMSTHESYPDRSPDDIAADNELRRRTAEPESHAGTVSESSTSPSYGQTE